MAAGFNEINPGVLAGGGVWDAVNGGEPNVTALHAMVGGVIGAIAGWAVKDNVLD
jgi:hypothetical protein